MSDSSNETFAGPSDYSLYPLPANLQMPPPSGRPDLGNSSSNSSSSRKRKRDDPPSQSLQPPRSRIPSVTSFTSSVKRQIKAQRDSGRCWNCEAQPTHLCHVLSKAEKRVRLSESYHNVSTLTRFRLNNLRLPASYQKISLPHSKTPSPFAPLAIAISMTSRILASFSFPQTSNTLSLVKTRI